MKQLAFLFFLFTTHLCIAQNSIIGYQYWFDDLYSFNTTVNVTPSHNFTLSNSFPTGALTIGPHTFSIRFKDNQNKWSPVLISLFYKMKEKILPNKIVAYRYWLDSDYASQVDSFINPAVNPLILFSELNLQTMTAGLHRLHIQFKDLNSNWSSVLTHDFYSGPYPKANFTALDSNICINGIINFVNQSVNSTGYYWDFGDGNISTDMNPNHQFNSFGKYNISLIASNTNLPGFNDTLKIENFVSVNYCDFVVNGKVFIEGYYAGNGMMLAALDPINYPFLCDTIVLQLAEPSAPYNIIYSTSSLLNTNGICQFQINCLTALDKYYFVVKHRNSIEVWSKTPIQINSPNVSIDFTKF